MLHSSVSKACVRAASAHRASTRHHSSLYVQFGGIPACLSTHGAPTDKRRHTAGQQPRRQLTAPMLAQATGMVHDASQLTAFKFDRLLSSQQPWVYSGYTFALEMKMELPSELSLIGVQQALATEGLTAWSVEPLGPIHGYKGRARTPVVVASSILSGEQGLHAIRRACTTIARFSPSVSSSSGFHIRVGKQGEPWDAEHLCNLAFNFMHHEKAFGLLAPQTSGGGPDEQYGRLLRLVGSADAVAKEMLVPTNTHGHGHGMIDFTHCAAHFDPEKLVVAFVHKSRRSLTGSPRAVKKRQMEGHLPHLLDFLNYENPYLALWVVARAVQLAAGGAAAAAQQDA